MRIWKSTEQGNIPQSFTTFASCKDSRQMYLSPIFFFLQDIASVDTECGEMTILKRLH